MASNGVTDIKGSLDHAGLGPNTSTNDMHYVIESNSDDCRCTEISTTTMDQAKKYSEQDSSCKEIEQDLESLALGSNKTDNKVEEMTTCVPTTTSHSSLTTDEPSTASLLTSPSLSPSNNCIMCRSLGCHKESIPNNKSYGLCMDEIDSNRSNLRVDMIKDMATTTSNKGGGSDKEEHDDSYFLVNNNRETSMIASGAGDIDDEGCFLSSLTPTNTSSKSYYRNCMVTVTSSDLINGEKSSDHKNGSTNQPIIIVGGDDGSSTSHRNNNVSSTSRSSFSERCSSSDVDSGRVSDTDTGTTSSTNSSNHIGEDSKYEDCLHQRPVQCIKESNKSQRLNSISLNEEQNEEDHQDIKLQSFSNDDLQSETHASQPTKSKSPQMVHIVSHSFCDFLGTLPGSESRCRRAKNSETSNGSERIICDNPPLSENLNANTIIDNSSAQNTVKCGRSDEGPRDEVGMLSNENGHTGLTQNMQHSQNKVTVFVPYSTIIRCMNETMDRKRKAKKMIPGMNGNTQGTLNDDRMFKNGSKEMTSFPSQKDSPNEQYHNEMPNHAKGSASCVGIVVGGGEPVKTMSDEKMNIQKKDVTPNIIGSALNSASEGGNKLYSKRMTKRLQQYNTQDGNFEHQSSMWGKSEIDSNGVNPCMLMLTEDSEELILPSPPPFPTSTTTKKVTNYDEIIRNELLQDSDDFLDQIRKAKTMTENHIGDMEMRRNGVGIPRRKDLCKLLGLNERNVGDLLIVPDEKVKIAQKVALMHKCNIGPPVPQKSNQSNISSKVNGKFDAVRSSRQENLQDTISNNSTLHGGNKENNDSLMYGHSSITPATDLYKEALLSKEVRNENCTQGDFAAGNVETVSVIPQRKKSKNLAKFFGVDDDLGVGDSSSNKTRIDNTTESLESYLMHNSTLQEPKEEPEDTPNIVLRRKKKKERSTSSEFRSNAMNKIGILDHGHTGLQFHQNQEHLEGNGGRPKSLLVSWNNLLKRSSVRWRNNSNHGTKGGAIGRLGASKNRDNYLSSDDDSDDCSTSDDDILQELQVPVQFRQMNGPLCHGKDYNAVNDGLDGENGGKVSGVAKRKDLSKFLGLDDSDSEEIVFIQNNKLPRQKPNTNNNDTFSSFDSFSKHSHNSSMCHFINNGIHGQGVSSHSSHTEVDSSSVGQIVEPSIGCSEIENNSSSSPTNTASTSTTYHPTCHLPLRNPILDMLENDMDNFEPPQRKSVVFKDYGLFSVEESIAQGLPIIPFDSINMSNDGRSSEKKKNSSNSGGKKRKKDADRRSSEIFFDIGPEPQRMQANARARSSSSESSFQVLFRNNRRAKGLDDNNEINEQLDDRTSYERQTSYRVGNVEKAFSLAVNGSHIPVQMRNENPPKRNDTCKKPEDNSSLDKCHNMRGEDAENHSEEGQIRSNQLPVRSALRSPNSPPKRPCGPVVFGANSRRTISPIRKTSNKPGVTVAYLPTIAQPMVPAVYYHNHRYPVILYGHHHPNMGYVSHVEQQSNSNFCRAFTRQQPPPPTKSTPLSCNDKQSGNASGGAKASYGPRLNSGSRYNGIMQRQNYGGRPTSGHFTSSKPPRQRQMVSPENDRATVGPPCGDGNAYSDSNGTYVIMKNGGNMSKKQQQPSSLMSFTSNDKNQLSNFL